MTIVMVVVMPEPQGIFGREALAFTIDSVLGNMHIMRHPNVNFQAGRRWEQAGMRNPGSRVHAKTYAMRDESFVPAGSLRGRALREASRRDTRGAVTALRGYSGGVAGGPRVTNGSLWFPEPVSEWAERVSVSPVKDSIFFVDPKEHPMNEFESKTSELKARETEASHIDEAQKGLELCDEDLRVVAGGPIIKNGEQ